MVWTYQQGFKSQMLETYCQATENGKSSIYGISNNRSRKLRKDRSADLRARTNITRLQIDSRVDQHLIPII